MTTNTHHEEAILHENAAKAHLIAAKQCEKSARAADFDASRSASKQVPDDGSAWYHADALKDSAPRHSHKA
jgi:hypothetical protein